MHPGRGGAAIEQAEFKVRQDQEGEINHEQLKALYELNALKDRFKEKYHRDSLLNWHGFPTIAELAKHLGDEATGIFLRGCIPSTTFSWTSFQLFRNYIGEKQDEIRRLMKPSDLGIEIIAIDSAWTALSIVRTFLNCAGTINERTRPVLNQIVEDLNRLDKRQKKLADSAEFKP